MQCCRTGSSMESVATWHTTTSADFICLNYNLPSQQTLPFQNTSLQENEEVVCGTGLQPVVRPSGPGREDVRLCLDVRFAFSAPLLPFDYLRQLFARSIVGKPQRVAINPRVLMLHDRSFCLCRAVNKPKIRKIELQHLDVHNILRNKM